VSTKQRATTRRDLLKRGERAANAGVDKRKGDAWYGPSPGLLQERRGSLNWLKGWKSAYIRREVPNRRGAASISLPGGKERLKRRYGEIAVISRQKRESSVNQGLTKGASRGGGPETGIVDGSGTGGEKTLGETKGKNDGPRP